MASSIVKDTVKSKSGLNVDRNSAAGQRVVASQKSSGSSSSSSSKSSGSSGSSSKGIAKVGSDGIVRYADGSTNDALQAYIDWNYGRNGGNTDYRNSSGSAEYQAEYDRLLSLKPGDSVWGSGSSAGGESDLMAEYKRALREAEDASAEAYQRQIESGVDQINAQRDPLKQQFDQGAQQAWIAQMQAKKNLPEQLAAQGVNGGATESRNIALETQYGNSLNNLTRDYNNNLASLDSDIAQLQATGNMQLAQNAAQYQQMLAQAILAQQQQQADLAAQMQLAGYNNDLAMQRDAAQASLKSSTSGSSSGTSKPRLTAAVRINPISFPDGGAPTAAAHSIPL